MKQEKHAPNFCKVMEWLQESAMQTRSYIDEVITTLIFKTPDGDRLVIEATITKDTCVISKMKYQQEEC